MKHLAVDWGGRRIGLATSDDAGTLAFPLSTRERRNFPADVAELLNVVRGVSAQVVVWGWPRTPDDAPPDAARQKREAEMRRAAAQLEKAAREVGLQLTTVWQDERFSTREALHGLRESGISQRAARDSSGADSVDARAAAVILQAYLDRNASAQGHDG